MDTNTTTANRLSTTDHNKRMKTINWGIIGLGKMARVFAEDLVLVKDCSLYAAASRSQEKADVFSKQFGTAKAYASYKELIEDQHVDIVYIATPHPFHFEIAMKCLKAKKHVLCEKPMSLHLEHTQALIQEARARNCFLMEAIWTRFMPTTKKLLSLLEQNQIGELISIEADFGFKAEYNENSRLFNKSLGGGSLFDIGIYPIFLSLLCLGKPSEIKALARKTSTQVDSFCSILFDYAADQKAILKSTFENHTPTEAILFGTKGSITIHRMFHQSEKIELRDEHRNTVELFHLPFRGNGYINEIEEVNSCIYEGKTESDLLPLDFSLHLAEILEDVKTEIDLKYD